MRKVEYWESFDGERFENEMLCAEYERNHPFFDETCIKFYSNNGNLITDPGESVFLDSNRFKVFNSNTLECYIKYCNNLHIKAPDFPSMQIPYPLHYRFINGSWECVEDEMVKLNYVLRTEFNDTVTEDAEGRHDLVEED